MDAFAASIAAVGCAVAFFGGIALIQWVTSKGEAQKRQLEHDLRLKALELGQPLPDADIARANAERTRAAAAATVGTLVPLFLIGAAVGATVLVLHFTTEDPHARGGMLTAIWIVCGVVCLVTVIKALNALGRRHESMAPVTGSGPRRSADRESAAFTERPPIS